MNYYRHSILLTSYTKEWVNCNNDEAAYFLIKTMVEMNKGLESNNFVVLWDDVVGNYNVYVEAGFVKEMCDKDDLDYDQWVDYWHGWADGFIYSYSIDKIKS
jgi:hypothetical protein